MSAISDITRRRDKLLAAALSCVDADETIDGPALGRMTDAVVKLLPQECAYDAVFKSLSPFLGSKPDSKELKLAAWAIAANIAAIKQGVLPYPARIAADAQQVTIQILACRRMPDRKGGQKGDAFTILYRGRIIKGLGCPLELEWYWSSKYVSFRASRPDGFGFKKPKYGKPQTGKPYQHFSTLVGMRFTTELSVAEDGKKVLDAVRCGQSLQEHNQALTEMRFRTTFECPMAYTHPCHHCPKGQTACPAACHPEDFNVRACASCGNSLEHDDYWKFGVCTKCMAAGRRGFL